MHTRADIRGAAAVPPSAPARTLAERLAAGWAEFYAGPFDYDLFQAIWTRLNLEPIPEDFTCEWSGRTAAQCAEWLTRLSEEALWMFIILGAVIAGDGSIDDDGSMRLSQSLRNARLVEFVDRMFCGRGVHLDKEAVLGTDGTTQQQAAVYVRIPVEQMKLIARLTPAGSWLHKEKARILLAGDDEWTAAAMNRAAKTTVGCCAQH